MMMRYHHQSYSLLALTNDLVVPFWFLALQLVNDQLWSAQALVKASVYDQMYTFGCWFWPSLCNAMCCPCCDGVNLEDHMNDGTAIKASMVSTLFWQGWPIVCTAVVRPNTRAIKHFSFQSSARFSACEWTCKCWTADHPPTTHHPPH